MAVDLAGRTLRTRRRGGDECWLNGSTVLLPDSRGTIVVHLFRDLPCAPSPQPVSLGMLRQVEHAQAANATPQRP